jgi:Zn finger protein HypA/HybF involved in hydrogenase expression
MMSHPPFHFPEPGAYCMEEDCAWHGYPDDCRRPDASDLTCPRCHSQRVIVNEPSLD